MLVRCPHCDHRIKVRNARPRTYELSCPRCERAFYLLIEREPGPDQLATVFQDFEEMKQQILEARAIRTSAKSPTVEPVSRPETPEVIQGVSESSSHLQDDEDGIELKQDRPDVPVSLAGLNFENTEESSPENTGDLSRAWQVLPHAVPSAFSEDDEDHRPMDLLEETQSQFNEEQMDLELDQEEPNERPSAITRPDSPRATEVEPYILRQRPEFTAVDEVIPTLPTGVDGRDRHADFSEEANSLVTDVDDVQAALPSDLLHLDDDEDDEPSLPDRSEPEVLSDNSPTKAKGWRRWFKFRR